MESRHVTTPFGRRPITLALVSRQIATKEIRSDKTTDKWKVFRDASEARKFLGVQDRSLAVLEALLSFYPENELRQGCQLVVFPSNAQLTLRAHGIAGATLRRHLALLVEAGLIVRRDSANGKRYARKNKSGSVESAFGFDLSPLLMRAEELAQLAQRVCADRIAYRRAKEDLTICRRDVRKLISAAIGEGADGHWQKLEAVYLELVRRIPRAPVLSDLHGLLEEMEMLREAVLNVLNIKQKAEFLSANDDHNEHHKQSSNTESLYELEPGSDVEERAMPCQNREPANVALKVFPLDMVLRACPEIVAYGPNGRVASWRDLTSASVIVRSMLGVTPSAYQETCDAIGPQNAAVMIACILERAGHINSAGGYMRALTSKSKRGQFSLGPVLMSLLRAKGICARSVHDHGALP
ncbi:MULTISPECIES: plasmid replication protein RepC [unclassified Ensifer]|uniref:plasmid replication protein RepC n=1 Tax=unclassified Ensifer TaxID=2633371 RepID=UPI00070B96C4|nr:MULTISPECIES: plasmid replication protein RepC [unclassified Ensifer]KQW61025.1 replication initiation protein RepC [Ensifer sp. Root1252]KRC77930.1 replication initiation protein RepC [Ensifer sp. Root231]KRD00350.1 replication initiation protein RepC [Ensifer sp. Root258]